jgi:hypothetical protein
MLFSPRPIRQHLTMSRAAAFGEHGIALEYPNSSWSGVRTNDGMVVFAVRAKDVIVDGQGSRCLLWAPDAGRTDALAREERLKHCILAIGNGQAEGLLAFENGSEIDPTLVLSLRVERYRGEYWAKWGSAVCVLPPSLRVPGWLMQPQHALAAGAGRSG